MHHKFLFSLLLLSIAEISAMETISNDIIVYKISPLLNRLTKNTFRLINTRHSQLIMPQSILNEKFKKAYEKNNINEMLELRKKGALHMHEEVYNLFIDNKKNLATTLSLNHTHGLGSFCLKSAFYYGIKRNNKQFITFLLNEKQPSYNSDVIKNSLIKSKKLEHNEIIQIIEQYIAQNKTPKCVYCYGMGSFYNWSSDSNVSQYAPPYYP